MLLAVEQLLHLVLFALDFVRDLLPALEDDFLRGLSGNDELFGGEDNDTLVVESFQDAAFVEGGIVDGGNGRDIALFDSTAGGQFDLTAVDLNNSETGIDIFDIEVISLEDNSGFDTFTLSINEIFDLSPGFDQVLDDAINSNPTLAAAFGGVSTRLTVYGDVDDELRLVDRADFSSTPEGQVSDGQGRTLNIYAYDAGFGAGVEAIVAVDDEVTVTTA